MKKYCASAVYFIVLLLCVSVPVEVFAASDFSLSTFSNLAAQADPQSGSATFSIPISVPAGRGGIQPNVQLQYNSSLPNGWAGYGWQLELGSIQRSTKNGIPKYDSTDKFILLQSGSSQELVDIGGGLYRPEAEAAFMKISFSNNTWTVTDKSGTKYIFGAAANSRQDHPTKGTYKWFLDRVQDINGNYMTLEYDNDAAGSKAVYPYKIHYTGYDNGQGVTHPPFMTLQFLSSSRSEYIRSYMAGFKIEIQKRMGQIVSFLGDDYVTSSPTQSRYSPSFNETISGNPAPRSILERVNIFGDGEQSAIPPLSFSYQPPLAYNLSALNDYSSEDTAYFTGDFNGDAKTDIGMYYKSSSSGNIDIKYSNGSGFDNAIRGIVGLGAGRMIFPGDYNSDGKTDIMVFTPTNGQWNVYASNGNTFNGTSIVDWNIGWGANNNATTGDFNGDGKTDIASFFNASGNIGVDIAYFTGTTFQDWNGANLVLGPADYTPFAADFNGDGLTDFGIFKKTSGDWRFFLNPGDPQKQFEEVEAIHDFGNNENFLVGDFNFDGWADVGWYQQSTGLITYMAFASAGAWSHVATFSKIFTLRDADTGITSGDFNGDSLSDFAAVNSNGKFEPAYSSGARYDLLSQFDNGVGGKQTIDYTSSTQFSNPELPFPLQVIDKVTLTTAQGGSYSTQYEYSQGKWVADQREFRGFGIVKTIDADGNYSTTQYLQDDVYKGRPLEQTAYDVTNKMLGKTKFLWNYVPLEPGSNFIFLRKKINYVYTTPTTGKATAEDYLYSDNVPQLGNLTSTVQWGEVDFVDPDVDKPGDKRTIEVSYTKNTTGSNWLHGIPKYTAIRGADDNFMRQTWFYYDGATDFNAAPSKAQLTQKKDWAGNTPPHPDPVSQYIYDIYGNLTETRDPLTRATKITYDPVYHMFPLTTENAIPHTVTNTYYGVNGVALSDGAGLHGLWGQLKSTTDPNNKTGTRSYDDIGRVILSFSPKDSLQFPTITKEYFPVIYTPSAYVPTAFSKVTTRQRITHGQAPTIDTVEYYDGLGRLLQAKAKAEGTNYVVNGQTEYNSRGLPITKYLPFFTTSDFNTIDAIVSTRPKTTIEYDAQGRVTKSINPGLDTSSFSTVRYDTWTTTATDENGHMQKSHFDAYGRLVRKEEYTGADGRGAPIYPSVSFSLYATTQYQYDSEGNLTKTIDNRNNQTTIVYDKLGRKVSMDDPDMGHWEYTYDANGNLISQKDAKLQIMNFTYDELNRLTNKTGPGVNVTYTYDSDAALNPNTKGRLTSVGYNGNESTAFVYDELGRETNSTKTINQQNFDVMRRYDALNRLEFLENPDQSGVSYEYNNAGQVEKVIESTPGPQSYLKKEEGFWGKFKQKSLTVIETALDFVTGATPAYAATNYLTSTNCMAAWKFDETSGNLADSCKTNTGIVTGTVTRGATGQFNKAVEFLGATTANNAVINAGSATVLDNLSARTIVAWIRPDNLGNGSSGVIVSKNALDGWTFRLLAGNNLEFTQAFTAGVVKWKTTSGAVILNTWQHVAVTYTGTTTKPKIYINGVEHTVVLNSTGPQTSWVKDNDSSYPLRIGIENTTQEFDGRIDELAIFNRILTATEINEIKTSSLSGGAPAVPAAPTNLVAVAGNASVNLTWNASTGATGYKVFYGTTSGVYGPAIDVGNVLSKSITGLTNGTLYYFAVKAYNTGGDSPYSTPASATPKLFTYVTNVDYNAAGQIEWIEYGNGVTTDYVYDQFTLRLTQIMTKDKTGAPIQNLSYTYDKAGNIVSITDAVNASGENFTYDELNRLKTANGSRYGPAAYEYNELGNIIEKDGRTYTYSPSKVHAVTSTIKAGEQATIYEYDPNGNMIKKTEPNPSLITDYIYDAENRLTRVITNGQVKADYSYDGDGGRTKKIVYGSPNKTTVYVGSLYEETNGKKTKFVYLGSTRVAAVTDETVAVYHGNHLGSTNIITNAAGAATKHIWYEPFGSQHEVPFNASAPEVFYSYTGHKYDDETGLLYLGARYYDPKLGRFITADTIVQNPYDPQTLSRYSYTSNNPINRIDPDGHKWSWKKFFGAAVGAIVGILSAGALAPVIGAAFASLSAGAVGAISGAIGGALGGTISAAIGGGSLWQGALMGGAFGALGGWAFAGEHYGVLAGMFIGGVAMTAVSGSWDSFAGGIVGAVIGTGLNSYLSSKSTPSAQGQEASSATPSEYQKMSDLSPEELTDIYNNVRTSAPKKAAVAQMIQQKANDVVTLQWVIETAKSTNDVIGLAGMALLLTPAAPIGAGIVATSSWVGVGLGIADGVANNSVRTVIFSIGQRYGGKFAGKVALKAFNYEKVSFNSVGRYISEQTGRYVSNIYGKVSVGIEHSGKLLFTATTHGLSP